MSVVQGALGDLTAVDAVRRLAGLRVQVRDAEALESWVAGRVEANALAGIGPYTELLAQDGDAGRRERELIAGRFTTCESYFFRDQGQFDLLATTLLPGLVERRAGDRKLRIWSAGCASGEEAYSLAMLVDELAPRVAGWDVLIVGSDINPAAIDRARSGVYGEWSFRTLDAACKQRYFRRQGKDWRIEPRLREMVRFRTGDLVHDRYPDANSGICDFDLILCRNVFIYLDPGAVASITAKLAATLAEGGILLTGHSELFGHDTAPLRVRMYPQSSVFVRTQRPTPEPAAPTPRPRRALPTHAAAPRAALGTAPRAALRTAPGADCEQLVQAAWRHADRGMREEAERDCRQAVAAAGFDPRPYYLLAQLAQERGDLQDAKAMLRKSIYLDPGYLAAYLELGALHAQAGEPERARRMYESARRELQKLPAASAVAPFGESSAAEVLAFVERLLGAPPG